MKKTLVGLFVLVLLAWLLVPAHAPSIISPAAARPFVWDQDELWHSLEEDFNATRSAGCERARERVDSGLQGLETDVEWLERGSHSPADERLAAIETRLFAVAPIMAACPERVNAFLALATRLRIALKRTSREWDITDTRVRDRVYRTLYGARMAVEEVLLQQESGALPDLGTVRDVPSGTPSVVINGLRIHSGDILVSRAGAPVSALIARGNDYPGNFSHIALVHVSEAQQLSVIEALIEVGVKVGTLDQYLADKKLRIMVLRLDNDLPQLQADPLLPHRAATAALVEARERHVPYDFAMHYREPGKKFCSEVASAPYADLGVNLWEGLTTMSSSGAVAWLSALGVEQFETHGPSDLEYDPKVAVVAEWRDRETLFDDHVDNAIIDAMLEAAEHGYAIDYDYRYLPLARILKAYSVLRNAVGKPGPVPEGMSATTALRSKWLDDEHARIKAALLQQVAEFREARSYTPPYWQLFEMARAELRRVSVL